ncbi:hypothetical protein [Pantanalinema sp. GBBB05]|uniref:hypothetical protein n=1 Tax=Pantanalinema sp. GBBB05 TaxID=2604139 RepID=UPI001DBF2481|nr:hypothetical protein [Pantanalinema sp. GBBB05]
MSGVLEIALILNLQSELTSEEIATLTYMTRSEDYSFPTLLSHPFFSNLEDDSGEIWSEFWRFIIANNRRVCGEKYLSQVRRSIFLMDQLCFRILIADDNFWYYWEPFSDWLFSISTDIGVVGYVLAHPHKEYDLIYFEENEIVLRFEKQGVPSHLLSAINHLLGGDGVTFNQK